MPDRCAYCGREEDDTDVDGYIHLSVCPVCTAIACPMCLAFVEFNEDTGDDTFRVWRAAVCKVHLPWNIVEGIKKNAKGENDNEQDIKVVGFDVDLPQSFIADDTPSMEFPELSKAVNAVGAIVVDKIAAYNLVTKDAIRVRVVAHKIKGGRQ